MSETTEHASAAHASSPASSHVPAWRGHGTVPVNLVLEGGAMRGQFTAGVLDFFMDQKLFCERVIGVSAGALCGYNYVAGEDGRTCYLNTKYCDDWRYLSMKSFVRTGNACGREFAFDEIPNRLEPFDYAGFDQSPMQLIAVSSDLVTGEADYHPFADSLADLPYLIASSSMPLVSQIVDVDGKLLLDGGTCDSVPIVYSMRTGARKHIVVLTQAADYVKGPNKLMAILRQRYGLYPTTSSACSTATTSTTARTARCPACTMPESCSSSGLPSRLPWAAWSATPTSCSHSTSRATPKRPVAGPRSKPTWKRKGRLSAPASQGVPFARTACACGPLPAQLSDAHSGAPAPKPQDVASRSRPHRSRRASRHSRTRVEAAGRCAALSPV